MLANGHFAVGDRIDNVGSFPNFAVVNQHFQLTEIFANLLSGRV